MYVSAKLDLEYKQELVNLLKEFKYCFAWKYYEMPGLDRSIIEIGCQSNLDIGCLNKLRGDSTQTYLMISKRRLKGY